MAYVACHDCNTMVHFNAKNEVEFHKRFVEGNEPIYCYPCFRKRGKNETDKEENIHE